MIWHYELINRHGKAENQNLLLWTTFHKAFYRSINQFLLFRSEPTFIPKKKTFLSHSSERNILYRNQTFHYNHWKCSVHCHTENADTNTTNTVHTIQFTKIHSPVSLTFLPSRSMWKTCTNESRTGNQNGIRLISPSGCRVIFAFVFARSPHECY